MSPEVSPNGWGEWSKYVLKELERLNGIVESLRAKIDNIDIKLIEIKSRLDSIDLQGIKDEFKEKVNDLEHEIKCIKESFSTPKFAEKDVVKDTLFGLEKKYVYIMGMLAIIVPIITVLANMLFKKIGL
jgi:hypothetical protein